MSAVTLVHISGRRTSQHIMQLLALLLQAVPINQTDQHFPVERPAFLFHPSRGVRRNALPVGLGDTLQLILLLDGVRVAGTLRGVDQLLSKALSNRLDVAEGGLAGTGGQECDGLVDTAQRGHIDGLSADGTGRADSGGVLTGSTVDDGVDSDLDGVLVGHQVNL